MLFRNPYRLCVHIVIYLSLFEVAKSMCLIWSLIFHLRRLKIQMKYASVAKTSEMIIFYYRKDKLSFELGSILFRFFGEKFIKLVIKDIKTVYKGKIYEVLVKALG